jgi:inward rectifier potassium channel
VRVADRAPEPLIRNEEERDLGFGSVLSRQPSLRLLNRDGSFNVRRKKLNLLFRLGSYHGLLTMPWWQLSGFVVVSYLAINALFALAYLACGTAALDGASIHSPFWKAFFFSVDTFATIGYGNIVPVGMVANALVTAEALVGLFSFAVVTGVVFARFARPTAQIIYSKHAIVAPYRGITAFEFRIINARDNQLIDLQATVMLTRFEGQNGVRQRRYYQLALERHSVAFFPLAWTVVHPIDENSPLFGWDQETLRASHAEFLILLRGTDETFAQTVHSRSSYSGDEVLWGRRFASLFQDGEDVPDIDMRRFHLVERAPIEAMTETASRSS